MSKAKFPLPLTLFVLSLFTINYFLLTQPSPAAAYPGPSGACKTQDECQDKLKEKAADWSNAVYGTEDMNLQSYVNEVFYNLIFSLVSVIAPPDQLPPKPDKLAQSFQDLLSGKLSENPSFARSLASIPATGIDIFYAYPPASGVDYVRSLAQDFSLTPPAHAQSGFGYNQLTSFRGMWKISRDAAYAVFVIVFIVAGFMIMFRVKLSPQTVATLQSLLPRVLLILLLITFSYAIVGFAIDLMYAITYLLVAILAPNTIIISAGNAVADFLSKIPVLGSLIPASPFTGIGTQIIQFGFNLPFWLTTIIPHLIVLLAALTLGIVVTMIVMLPGALLMALPTLGASVIITPTIGLIVGVIAAIVMLVIMIINSFKIFVALAKAYVGVFIALVTGPLQIIFGIMPGSKSISSWSQGLLANLAVFPTVYVMFLLIEVLFVSLGPFSGSTVTWIPPLLAPNPAAITGSVAINSLAGMPAKAIVASLLIAGVYLLIPKAADIIKSMIEGKPFPYGTALTENWKAVKPYLPATYESARAGFEAATSGETPPPAGKELEYGIKEFGKQFVARNWEVVKRQAEKSP